MEGLQIQRTLLVTLVLDICNSVSLHI